MQVLIDDEWFRRLEREAARRKVPVSVLVRDAIDAAYPVDLPRRRGAAQRILRADPMPVAEPELLRRELDELRGRRA